MGIYILTFQRWKKPDQDTPVLLGCLGCFRNDSSSSGLDFSSVLEQVSALHLADHQLQQPIGSLNVNLCWRKCSHCCEQSKRSRKMFHDVQENNHLLSHFLPSQQHIFQMLRFLHWLHLLHWYYLLHLYFLLPCLFFSFFTCFSQNLSRVSVIPVLSHFVNLLLSFWCNCIRLCFFHLMLSCFHFRLCVFHIFMFWLGWAHWRRPQYPSGPKKSRRNVVPPLIEDSVNRGPTSEYSEYGFILIHWHMILLNVLRSKCDRSTLLIPILVDCLRVGCMFLTKSLPVVPHNAVAEVSKIGNLQEI